ncbi:pre-16S rRNA-processing nuclease YqgF [Acaryochloris sp. IP29b_bin.148]|uniref:pre-16S rRNA-processing nuclease YqgF n=1 Tax=Acaryochloris sp. IP29b_bin.148 TaxID=2969218 RepID=UPI00262089BD|nr:pre-16S rRNA-processing nuclease YqgF [Acaryochloris sp. IP29b_bin.148]
MSDQSHEVRHQPMILGFDPGRHKCGLAVMEVNRIVHWHHVVAASQVIESINQLCETYPIFLLVMGNQTTSKEWYHKCQSLLTPSLQIQKVDERYSTLAARTKYWQMFPPQGINRLIPQSLRTIHRPIDDIVAIILVERYLEQYEVEAISN